jgi:hypothetical protein
VWGGGSVGLRWGNEVEDVEPIGEECDMRSLVLGAFIFVSFGLTANAAESYSDAKAAAAHARRACQVVTADRSLRLLRDVLPGDRRIAADRPASRPASTATKEPVVRASRPATPVHFASRSEPVRLLSRLSRAEPVRLLAQHVSLVVGVGF